MGEQEKLNLLPWSADDAGLIPTHGKCVDELQDLEGGGQRGFWGLEHSGKLIEASP